MRSVLFSADVENPPLASRNIAVLGEQPLSGPEVSITEPKVLAVLGGLRLNERVSSGPALRAQ